MIGSLLIVGAIILDRIYMKQTWIIPSHSWLAIAIVFLLCVITVYHVIRVLFSWLDLSQIFPLGENSITDETQLSLRVICSGRFVQRFTFILLCWVPYMIIRFPGGVDTDTVWEVVQGYGMTSPSDHHPWLDTLIFSAFWHLGDASGNHSVGIAVYAIIQMLITAAVFSLCLCYMSYFNVPESLVRGLLLFISLFPIFPIFAQTMAKDSLFGWIWLLFILGYVEIWRSSGAVFSSWKFDIIYAAIVLLSMLTKKTGIYLVILCAICLIVHVTEYRSRLVSVVLVPAVLFTVLWSSILLPMWGVQKGESSEMLSIPSQQTAYYLKTHANDMNDSDWQSVEGMFTDAHSLASAYAPSRADNTKNRIRNDASTLDKIQYMQWYCFTMLKHPGNFALSALALTLPLYYPDTITEGVESSLYYMDHLTSFPDTGDEGLESFIASITNTDINDVNDLTKGMRRNSYIAGLSKSFDTIYLLLVDAFPIIFSKVLYVFWLPLTAACYCLRRRKGSNLLLIAPFFFMLLTLIAGPISLPRYFVPVMYTLPVLALSIYICSVSTSTQKLSRIHID